MLKKLSAAPSVIYGWIVLAAIPVVVMGWTITLNGPSHDGWVIVNQMYQGNIYGLPDATRPLASIPHIIMWATSGGNMTAYFGEYVLLEMACSLLYFGVLSRILTRTLGRIGVFAALAASLIYVLYPSYIGRLYLGTSNDSFNRAMTAGIAMLWVIACERDQIRWAIGAAVLTVLTLLHKENSLLLFGLFPFITLAYGFSPFKGKWRIASAALWGLLGLFVLWRVGPPEMGGVGGIRRTVEVSDPIGIFPFFGESLADILVGAYQIAFGQSLAELQAKGWGWISPVAAAGAALVTAIGALIWRREGQPEAPRQLWWRPWAAMCLAAAIAAVLGVTIFYFFLGHPTPIDTMESRNTTVAMMGVSLLYGLLAVFPTMVTRQTGRWQVGGLVVTIGLVALLLAGGIIRQVRMDVATIESWQIQRAFWQRMAEVEVSARPDGLVLVLDSFPKGYDSTPLASHSLGNREAMRTLFDLPPDLVTFNEADAITHTLTDRTISVTTGDGELTVPLENFRVLYYDRATGLVEVVPHLPLSWTSEREYIYTGENPAQSHLLLTPYGATLLGDPIAAGQCQTRVPVHSIDTAPEDGVVEVALYPQNVVLDRRRVSEGTSLEFSFMAPCGVWIRAYFVRDGGSTEMLVSQYGEGQEYGTSEEAASPSYETAFEKAVGAEPLH